MKNGILWSEDEIEVRDDGFLWAKGAEITEEQPLLLHSTEVILQLLYPSVPKQTILSEEFHSSQLIDDDDGEEVEVGDTEDEAEAGEEEDGDNDNGDSESKDNGMEADEVGDQMEVDHDVDNPMEVDGVGDSADSEEFPGANSEEQDNKLGVDTVEAAMAGLSLDNEKPRKVPPQYKKYQHLERCNNLSARAQSALLDIRHSRHRKKRDQNRERLSREEMKVRALEAQQQRLLSQRSDSVGESSVPTEEETGEPDEWNADDQQSADDEVEEDLVHESQSIRVARTINSVRALYPHLLPMLNHPRRNDKKMVIKDVRWKSKRRAMCWIVGTHVFDTTTNKLWTNIYDDARIILEGFIPVPLAGKIAADPSGSLDYWKTNWIQDMVQRSQPRVLNPLSILAETGYLSSDGVWEIAYRCDKDLCQHVSEGHNSKKQKRYEHAVEKLHRRLTNLLTRRFPKARVSIYGSCFSNLSLGVGADVDLSLWIPEADKVQASFQEGKITATRYEKDMKRLVYQVFHKLKNLDHEFHNMQAITRARVPVVKGTYNFADNPYSHDGSINFDICFLNDIAVANSGLLRQYSLVDPRVRSLMMTVKQWAKAYNINSAKDNFISSYAWINLVIFYLQCLGFVPNLQDRELMALCNVKPNPEGNYWHFVNKLDTCTLTWEQISQAKAWSQPDEFDSLPVSALLYGFFEFYSCRFPSATFAVSIKEGTIKLLKCSHRKFNLFFCIEDPFETFDSHTPHDLGTPAGEKGARDIMKFLQEAERHLRKLLCGEIDVSELWPEPPFLEPMPALKNAHNPKFTRFQPKSNDTRKLKSPVHRGKGGQQGGPKADRNQNASDNHGGEARGPGRRKGGQHGGPGASKGGARNHDPRESTQSPGQPTGQHHGGGNKHNNRNQNRSRKGKQQNQNNKSNNSNENEQGNDQPKRQPKNRSRRINRGKQKQPTTEKKPQTPNP